jgi:site-specific DNA recombinase
MEGAMRAIVYSRVSTDAQERDGTSLDTQERAGVELAQRNGWLVVERIRDAASGYSLDRDGIARLRQLLKQGAADIVVAHAVDRLSRNQNHIGVLFDEVQQEGARLEFVTEKFEDTAVGRFILAVRAFIAEVEREKIVERTTRGKLERARQGKIPQAFGKGTYGYTYNPATGRREVDPYQAAVVRRIFGRYAETRSINVVARELNDEGTPAFAGGKWYPLTIRRILGNESYTGRLIFRRTRWVATRSQGDGKRRRKAVERPAEDWVEIEGASPRVVDEQAWERVQAILTDPERVARRPAARAYVLRGRVKCGACGSAMVGQTMNSRGKPFFYYGCRHAYDKRTGHSCASRFIRAERLEEGIWREVAERLAKPDVVLQEWRHQNIPATDDSDMERMERELAALKDREKRLVKLFTYGEIDDQMIRDEAAKLRRERSALEERLRAIRRPRNSGPTDVDPERLAAICQAVAGWLERAGDEDRRQVLEALQMNVLATTAAVSGTGVLPLEQPARYGLENNHADARAEMINAAAEGIPFSVTIRV